jgi:flagellar M-ring protein FliF
VNAAFQTPEPIQALPEPPLWEQAWFWDLLRQIGGVLLVLVLIFGVLRPTLKRLTAQVRVTDTEGEGQEVGGDARATGNPAEQGIEGELDGPVREGAQALPGREQIRLPGPGGYENTLDAARQLVRDDPKRVAQVVRRWIAEGAG